MMDHSVGGKRERQNRLAERRGRQLVMMKEGNDNQAS